MNICILTIGTRGDVQPYLALAVELQRQGHDVRLATSEIFRAEITSWGIHFSPLRADYLQLTETPEGKKALSGNPWRAMVTLKNTVEPLIAQTLEDCWQAAQDAELIIFHPKTLAGPHIMECLNVSGVMAATVPMFSATSEFPLPALLPPSLRLGAAFNRWSYGLMAQSTRMFQGVIQHWRKSIGLPAQPKNWHPLYSDGRKLQVLYCISEQMLPKPKDWDNQSHLGGFWFLPETAYQAPHALQDFLSGDKPVVYVGFGSMTHQNPVHLTQQVIQAAKALDVKVVLSTASSALSPAHLPEWVYPVAHLPHHWLFPRMNAVVHHGGLGTSAATLRAGVPSVLCPFTADQPFWAHVLRSRGLTATPVPQKNFSARALESSLTEALTSTELRQNLKPIAEALQHEKGAQESVQWLSQTFHLSV